MKPTEDQWLPAQFTSLSDEAKHPGCPVHHSATDAGEHTTVRFAHRPWMIWNHGLTNCPRMITNGRSTRWKAPGTWVAISPPGRIPEDIGKAKSFKSISWGVHSKQTTRSLRQPTQSRSGSGIIQLDWTMITKTWSTCGIVEFSGTLAVRALGTIVGP